MERVVITVVGLNTIKLEEPLLRELLESGYGMRVGKVKFSADGKSASAELLPSPNRAKLTGMAFRVPTSDVSVVDLTAWSQNRPTS